MPPTTAQVPSLPCRAPRCCSAPLDTPGDADPGHGCAAKSPYPPAQDLVDSRALLQGALSDDFCPHLFHIQHESVQGLLDSGLLGFLLSLWFWLRFPWQGHKRSSQCQQSQPSQHPAAGRAVPNPPGAKLCPGTRSAQRPARCPLHRVQPRGTPRCWEPSDASNLHVSVIVLHLLLARVGHDGGVWDAGGVHAGAQHQRVSEPAGETGEP